MTERAMACMQGCSGPVEVAAGGHLLSAHATVHASPGGAIAAGDGTGVSGAASAYELMLASLAACTALTLGRFAASRQWPLISIDVYLKLEPGGRHIDRQLLITGLDQQSRAALLNLARDTPISRLLAAGLSISTKLL